VNQQEAVALIRDAVTARGGTWADLGAGAGTFSRALASLLGPDGVVYAVDRDASALRDLERAARGGSAGAAPIRTIVGDFTDSIALPPLDGTLLANALHYVPYDRQADVLRRIATLLGEGGAIVVIEYDRRGANPWVPYPITLDAFGALARDAHLGEPVVIGTRPSRFSGTIYSAVVRPARRV
jgi:SAM-dependent methyltransferase